MRFSRRFDICAGVVWPSDRAKSVLLVGRPVEGTPSGNVLYVMKPQELGGPQKVKLRTSEGVKELSSFDELMCSLLDTNRYGIRQLLHDAGGPVLLRGWGSTICLSARLTLDFLVFCQSLPTQL